MRTRDKVVDTNLKEPKKTAKKIEQLITRMPSKSVRQLAQEVGHRSTLVHSVLHTDLVLKLYKIKLQQPSSAEDKKQRLTFATRLNDKDKVNSDQQFTSRVRFPDENTSTFMETPTDKTVAFGRIIYHLRLC